MTVQLKTYKLIILILSGRPFKITYWYISFPSPKMSINLFMFRTKPVKLFLKSEFFLPCQMTEDHTAWHTLSLFLQQRWGPLGRRLPLGDQGDASGPVSAQVISSNPPQTKNIMFTWQFCICLFVQYIQQFTVYLTVLCDFFLQYVKWLKVYLTLLRWSFIQPVKKSTVCLTVLCGDLYR